MLPELAQIELLAQVDELIATARRWIESDLPWSPLQHCHAVVRRLLARVETLRVRLESPLVVATFGGTGTGKSSLVNALVGLEVSASGRQRPTTMRPTLIAHQLTELEPLGLPLDQFSIIRCDAPLLRDIVLIDCPDPDTTEAETHGSNLERLHKLLPYCDVLIYTSTQQKYRSARVGGELFQAATGCRLVFVQTHADLDQDVREDWRQQLEEQYRVPNMFFIDSLRALREQQAGQRPAGDFRRLEDLLSRELSASHRTQVRRANLLDLVQATLDHCRSHLAQHGPALRDLDEALEQQHRKLTSRMADRLRGELLQCGILWERRLLDGVTETWGSSPFSTVLRVYNGLGNWIASAGLFRARTTAQMALIGAVQGVRWLASRQAESQVESQLGRLASLGLDDSLLRESQVVIDGFVRSAQLNPQLLDTSNFAALRSEAARVEGQFLGDASRRVDALIGDLLIRHTRLPLRIVFEMLWGLIPLYIVARPAYNFFYAEPVLGQPLLSSDFYIHGIVFLILWSWFLAMTFARRLRRGLHSRIATLAVEMADVRLATDLFPRLEETCRNVRTAVSQLESLATRTADLRRNLSSASGLGALVADATPRAQ
jgi:energy-coupling factor transporter ATP-binding protein EcfA2